MSSIVSAGRGGATFLDTTQGRLGNQERETWQDRIRWIVSTYELGSTEAERKAAVADKVGVSGETLRLYWTGANKPGLDVLERFVEEYPALNPHWLLTGYPPRERVAGRDTERRADAFDRVAAVVLEVVDYNATTPTDEEIAAELRRRGYLVDRDANGPEETHPEA